MSPEKASPKGSQSGGTCTVLRDFVSTAKMASPLAAARRTVAFNAAAKRQLSDISITRTGKPIVRVEGGR